MRLNNRKWGWRILGVLLASGLVLLPVCGSAMAAVIEWTQTTRTDFETGTAVQLDTSGTPGDVKLAVAGVSYLYAFRGNNQKTFWKYAIASNTWTPLADAPDKVRWGGALAYDGGNYIYAFRGNNYNDFWRYSISTNTWADMSAAPGTVRQGGALTYLNGYIYALRGDNTRDFWRYNIAADSWAARADTHINIQGGGALTGDGGNYVYAFQSDGVYSLWRYDISLDSWTVMRYTPDTLGEGAALTYDGGQYIYALRGMNTDEFWRYDTQANVWAVKSSTPADVDWGGSLAFTTGNYIYAFPGAYSQYFWRFNIFYNLWESYASTPASIQAGGALVSGPPAYYPSGSMVSASRDTGYNADFGTISWTAAVPSGTTIKFQLAANNDNLTWVFKGPDGGTGTYYTSSGAAIWPGLDGSRYIKYKAFFNTPDTGVTPALHDITITYSRQVLLPAVTTDPSSPVEETTATLRGTVTNDGGEACQYRFRYGTVTGNYTADTGWTGSVTTGTSFSADVIGLSKGTKYYYQAQLKNSNGTGSGPELSWLTKPDPPVEGSFIAKTISDTQINLSWVKGEGARRTMIRRRADTYPLNQADGVQVYFDTGTSVADTGLTPGKTYYYSAWSEVTGSQQWSDASRAASAVTNTNPPVAVGGTVYKVNKALVLAPWLGTLMLLLAGSGAAVRLWKRVKA